MQISTASSSHLRLDHTPIAKLREVIAAPVARIRYTQCDARLPACQNCHKSGLSCSFYDDVLQQDVPRSHIKSLYDRIEELKAIVAVHHTHSQNNDNTTSGPTDSGGAFQFVLPSRNGTLFLEQSPPVIIGDATVRKLLNQGVKIESPFLVPGNLNPEEEGINVFAASRFDRASVTPNTVRLLLAHYVRCVEPALPASITLPDENEASLKQMGEADRCCVLLACAIAATHKSYYAPAWKIVASTCREWGGELAAQFVTKPNDHIVVILLLLIIYELADPERGLIWELLSFATRSCLELGWHRTDEQAIHPLPGPTLPASSQTRRLPPETKKRTLSVLIYIER
ncbi:fungal specific transcription factor domain-containing protein [Diaporthe amygdali]|uniref:fungal specific transcription factor domain-containing protein n=1 Tax=Phomopsis amygdali TaxID=1214568 RepID=UPI0022FEA184|nr:fungal specific transcription factor domain-containing protein [Diaporthe amygdali]KAJ0117297.1 fungal specific transcription factor domain-containing protein [Diaporthe amygdali]